MINALNFSAAATTEWKNNIAKAGATLVEEFDVPDDKVQEFMAQLASMGPEMGPAIAQMLSTGDDGFKQLQGLFEATTATADAEALKMTDIYGEMTDSAPTLAEGIADGTATVEDILAELPAAMEEAGLDFETAAGEIDVSDEMTTVGNEAVEGLVIALEAGIGRAAAAGRRLANAAAAGTSSALFVYSPSRVFYEIGEFTVEGLILGIQSKDEEATATAVQTASLLTNALAKTFRDADDPQREALRLAQDIADTIVDELIAEQEAVADAAEALAEAAADRLSEAWDRVMDRFRRRDIAEAIADAEAELAEARADLASAESLAGAEGAAALAAAERRVAEAEAALALAEAADEKADALADEQLKTFKRGTEDAIAALKDQQEAEQKAIQQRIEDAKRNLDPEARAAAERALEAANERHEAERLALQRRREDEESVLRARLDSENEIREAAIKAQEDELKAFEGALDDIVDSISDAIEGLPGLLEDIADAERGLQEAFFDKFEEALADGVSPGERNELLRLGAQAGLTPGEVQELVDSALASQQADAGAAAAASGLGDLLDILSTGLYTIGEGGALGIAAGLSDSAQAIAEAMFGSVQQAIAHTLDAMEISSPSKLTERMIGKPLADGIAAGIAKQQTALSSSVTGLIDNAVYGSVPSSSRLVESALSDDVAHGVAYNGPLVTMPGAVIQDATDADLVAQQVVVALGTVATS
jgi:hypothetical protein